jgi:hypothetical protein
MVLIEINKQYKLFHISFLGHVTKAELVARYPETEVMLGEFTDGFHVLSDLARLETMDRDCMLEIGRVMELCEAKGVESVVRVIPDPKKDIGLNILSLFHYTRKIHPVTCETLEEALKILGM